MKTQSIKLRNWGIAMVLLALGSPIITSCSKDQNDTEIATINDQLTISINGINVNPQFKSASNNINYDVKEYGDADIAFAITDVSPTDAIKFKNSNNYEPIENGVKYVIYIYDGNALVTSKEFSAGTSGTISGLNTTTNYKWVAVSYSNKTNAPELNPSGTLALPQNTDVLHAQGNINLSQSSNLSIAFDHVMSRIGIELNTIGVFGTISGTPTVEVKSGALRTGVLNLINGEITANSSTYTPTLNYSNFVPVNGSQDAVHTYFYTVPTGTSENQSVVVNIKNLSINHYDGNQPRTYFSTTTGTDFTFNLLVERGISRKALLNIIESPLKTTYNGRTVQWARSNIYYRGDFGPRSYSFYANNELTSRADGYFGFKAIKPLQFATTTNEGDPCALVYPLGLWRQPLNADFNNLVNEDPIKLTQLTDQLGTLGSVVNATGIPALLSLITGLVSNTLFGAVNVEAPNSSLAASMPYQFGQYTISEGAPSSGVNAFGDANNGSNNLRFYYNGQINNLSVLQQIGNGDGVVNLGLSNLSASLLNINLLTTTIPLLDSYGNVTTLWTSEKGAEVLGLVSAGSWGYFGTVGRNFSFPYNRTYIAHRTGEILNGVGALGVDVLSTTFKNVRCVRN